MAVINHAKREINAKIVYYGSPCCGKGELFRFIHQRIKPSLCGPLKTMPAGSDTLLFFDYIPFENSSLDGYRIRFHLYTLTGPVCNPGTWKMVLKGVDGLAFVTNEACTDRDASAESYRVLGSMLGGYGKDLRVLPQLWLSCGDTGVTSGYVELEHCFAGKKVTCVPATGEGVLQSLAQLSQLVLQQLRYEYELAAQHSVEASVVSKNDVNAHSSCLIEADNQRADRIILPEVRMSLSGNSTIQIPIQIEKDDSVTRYLLSVALQVEEG